METPQQLILAPLPGSLNVLREPEFLPHQHRLVPALDALKEINSWIWDNYSQVVHQDAYDVMYDGILLLEMSIEICGLRFQT